MATGDQSGSWGTTTNTNLELIAEAFSFGTEAITTNADTHTTTIADGSTDPGRSIYLKYTGTLDSACTITIGPNTVSKLWFIENGTSGSQNIIISQGSGANVTVPAGEVKAIYSDGAGSGAAMVDAFANLKVSDAAQTNITSLGTLTTLTVDDITLDGSTISDAGDLTLDVGGDIVLDAAGQQIFFTSAGTNVGQIDMAGTDLEIKSLVSNADFFIRGNDDGSEITALTLDMSDAGSAYFNNKVGIGTTSPDAPLHINGSANSEQVIITGNTNANRGLSIQTAASGGQQDAGVIFNAQDTESGANPYHAFQTAGTEHARITSDGSVGIGTTSPGGSTSCLHVVHDATEGTPSFPDGEVIIAQRNFNSSQGCHIGIIAGTASESAINFGDKDDSDIGNITYNHSSNSMQFITNTTERMRILSGGVVAIGKTTYDNDNIGVVLTSTNSSIFTTQSVTPVSINRKGTDGDLISFTNDQAGCGSISCSGTTTAYNTSSDYRLKENVVELTDALTRVGQLQPKRFNFISDADTTYDGFLAHEVSSIVPEAIKGEKDAVDGEGNPEYQGIDQSKLVPLLVKAIQEQQEQIDALQSEIKTLKGE